MNEFIESIKKGDAKKVEISLKNPVIDINVKINGTPVLLYASYHGYEKIVELLLKHKDIRVNDTNNEGISSLLYASYLGSEKIVKLLLNHPDIDVNFKQINTEGVSPLIVSTEKGFEKIVELLLNHKNKKGEYDVEVNFKNKRGATALMIASQGFENIVKTLLKHPNVDVNVKSYELELTALIIAAEKGNEKIVELLLSHPDIDVNAKTKDNVTSLIYGIHNIKIVKLLLNHKNSKGEFDVDVFVKDNNNHDAFYHADFIAVKKMLFAFINKENKFSSTSNKEEKEKKCKQIRNGEYEESGAPQFSVVEASNFIEIDGDIYLYEIKKDVFQCYSLGDLQWIYTQYKQGRLPTGFDKEKYEMFTPYDYENIGRIVSEFKYFNFT